MKLILFATIIMIVFALVCLTRTTQENMAYLDQYEFQDNYRNVPESWPIPYTSTTALYAAKRRYLAELLGDQ